MESFFKVRCTRSEAGTYVLSYGKGSKKIGAMLDHLDNGDWVITQSGGKEFDRSDKKREVIDAWEKWAASAYGSDRETPPTTGSASDSLPSAGAAQSDEERPSAYALSEWERGFFLKVSEHKGQLTEWYLAQMKATLRHLTDTPAAPQLALLYSKMGLSSIQASINDAKTRGDQIRRWFQAYVTTGNEFVLPPTSLAKKIVVILGPPRFTGAKSNGVSSNPSPAEQTQVDEATGAEQSEAPAADTDSTEDVQSSEISCTEQAGDAV